MFSKKSVVLMMLLVIFASSFAFCAEKDFSQEKIIEIATKAVKDKGIVLTDVEVLYDEGGKLWLQRIGSLGVEDSSPNYGILKKGFLKNYRIIYFDFKEPIKDIWVFIDKDTGDVLTVYREE